MPSKPLKPCTTPGCSNLCKGGRCDSCGGNAKQGWGNDKERGTRTQRGYGNDWLRLRVRKIKINPLCEECSKHGKVVLANEVHHKIAFRGVHDPLRLDWNNLESLCTECHGRKTAAR